MKSNDERKSLLKVIVNAEPGFKSAIKELENYNWDFNDNPVIVDKAAFKNILSRFITGSLKATYINEWAEFLELREDVDYEEKDESLLSDILHELANPDIEGSLTIVRANLLLAQL